MYSMPLTPYNCCTKYYYPGGCTCFCMELRLFLYLVFTVTLIWVAIELTTVDRFVSSVTPILCVARNDVRYVRYKLGWIAMLLAFALFDFLLLFGLHQNNRWKLTFFLWYAALFQIVHIVMVGAATYLAVADDKMTKRQYARAIGAGIWHLFYVYLMVLINRYKVLLNFCE